MDILPAEMLEEIFKYLDLEDRIRIRPVSRTWKYLVENLKSNRSLILTENSLYKNVEMKRWFIDDYEFKNVDQLFYTFYFLDKLFSKAALTILDLRRLVIYVSFNYEIENPLMIKMFKFVDNFKRLNKLEINNKGNLELYDKSMKMNLPELTVLCLKGFKFDEIELDMPKLVKVYLEIINIDLRIHFKYPQSIKQIKLLDYNDVLAELVNLESIYIKRVREFESNFLSKFKYLKELNIDDSIEQFACLLEQKDRLGFTELATYFRSILVNDIDYEYKRLVESNSTVMDVYFRDDFVKTDQLPLVQSLDYNYLEDNSIKIHKSILDKFVNLECIYTNQKVKDVNKLEQLIRDCKNSLDLTFEDSLLSQAFYDRLPDNHKYIVLLRLSHNFADTDLNLDFIFKLNNLLCFIIDKELSLEFIELIFDRLVKLSTLKFNYKGHSFRVLFIFPEDVYDKYEVKFSLFEGDESDDRVNFGTHSELIGYLRNIDDVIAT